MKKRRKKRALLVIVACFLLCLNFSTVSAETTASVYLRTEKGNSGIIKVTCEAKDLGKVSNGKLRILYNGDQLTLERTEISQEFKSNFSCSLNDPLTGNKKAGEVVLAFASAEEKEVEGTILTFTFSTSDEVALADVNLTVKVEELKKSGETVNVTIADTVVGSEPAKITEPEGSVSQKTDVNTLSVSTIETQTFTGKLQRPSVEVKNGDTLLTEGVDYALSYSKNRKVGRAVVKISGIGSYEGTRKVFFYIAPKAPSYRRLTLLENNKIYVKWRKVKNAGGYQIQLASNRKFTKNVRSIEINKNTKLSKKIKVKSKKKYVYVRICSYKVFNGIIYYGNYGKVKRVRINS